MTQTRFLASVSSKLICLTPQHRGYNDHNHAVSKGLFWHHKFSLAYRIKVAVCCQLGMPSATHLEETLVSWSLSQAVGCDLFGFVVGCLPNQLFAVHLWWFPLWTSYGLWVVLGKVVRLLWPFLCHLPPVWMVLPENFVCVKDASGQGNLGRREEQLPWAF